MFKYIKNKLKKFGLIKTLEDKGERVDINLNDNLSYNEFNIYEKSHYSRYEFATTIIKKNGYCGDFACGSGYGTILLRQFAGKVVGIDIDKKTIDSIKFRYKNNEGVEFIHQNLLELSYNNLFDNIISFETVEHLEEKNIHILLSKYYNALKENSTLIFSTPYMQEDSEAAIKMGFHKTFFINEEKIKSWLSQVGFKLNAFYYQNYNSHKVVQDLEQKEFIICVAQK